MPILPILLFKDCLNLDTHSRLFYSGSVVAAFFFYQYFVFLQRKYDIRFNSTKALGLGRYAIGPACTDISRNSWMGESRLPMHLLGLCNVKEITMSMRRWIGIIFAVGLFFGVASGAGAEGLSPTETIRKPVDQVILILKDPAFHDPGTKAVQRQKIWKTIRLIFDFDEISRRTIGTQWQKFSPEEQKRFIEVFTEFLGNTVVDKLQGEYRDETIQFVNELIKGDKALVRTKLVRQDVQIPFDFLMKSDDGHWLVFDILVENGVSLVQNYRVQFRSALETDTPAQLIQRLEEKLAEQRKSIDAS